MNQFSICSIYSFVTADYEIGIYIAIGILPSWLASVPTITLA